MVHIIIPKELSQATVRREGTQVALLLDGQKQKMFMAEWPAVEQIARALLAKCREAEQFQKAQQTVEDQALLTRIGAPVGLIPKAQPGSGLMAEEAAREAQHNPTLRRYLPGSIKSKQMVYAPGVHRHPPEEQADGQEHS